MFGYVKACGICDLEPASVGFICCYELYVLGSQCLIDHIKHCGGTHYGIDISFAEKLVSSPTDLIRYLGEPKISNRLPKVGKFKSIFVFPELKDQIDKTLESDLELSLKHTAVIQDHSNARFFYFGLRGDTYKYDIIKKSSEPIKINYRNIKKNPNGEIYYKKSKYFYKYDSKTLRSIKVLSLPGYSISGTFKFHREFYIFKDKEYKDLHNMPAISFYTNRIHLIPAIHSDEIKFYCKKYDILKLHVKSFIKSSENRLYIGADNIGEEYKSAIIVCDSSLKVLYKVEVYGYIFSLYGWSTLLHRNMLYFMRNGTTVFKIDLSPKLLQRKSYSLSHYQKNFNSRYYYIQPPYNHVRQLMIVDLKYLTAWTINITAVKVLGVANGELLLYNPIKPHYQIYNIITHDIKFISQPEYKENYCSLVYHEGYLYAISAEAIYRYIYDFDTWNKLITLPNISEAPYSTVIIGNLIYIIRNSELYIDVYDIGTNEYRPRELKLNDKVKAAKEVEGKIFILFTASYQIYDRFFNLLEEGESFMLTYWNNHCGFYKGMIYCYDNHCGLLMYLNIRNKETGGEIIQILRES